MSKMLVGSIDLNKIEKERIVTKDKDGKPFSNGAKYYNIVVWVNDEADQYGNNASIQTSIDKEERENGQKGSYIGNLKFPISTQQPTPLDNMPIKAEVISSPESDDLPF